MTRWLGHWRLLPELTIGGDPVTDGTYRIEKLDEVLRFTVRWREAGEEGEALFEAVPDGRRIPSEAESHDAFTVLAEDADTLSGTAWMGKRQIARALRRVSKDGRLMTVLQERLPEDGPPEPAFQVYERLGHG
ncbi:MAG: hypothetical protein QNJ13_15855 [Paracoccaceae bacterium]|nr:hypothetical protein [Paracoccaceae bacterium]